MFSALILDKLDFLFTPFEDGPEGPFDGSKFSILKLFLSSTDTSSCVSSAFSVILVPRYNPDLNLESEVLIRPELMLFWMIDLAKL